MMVSIIKYGVRSSSFRYISNLLSEVLFPRLVLAAVGLLGLNDPGDRIDLMGPSAASVMDLNLVDARQFHFQSPFVYIII